jgi:RNA polymerase sigma-70 factor (ECF subfamily)
MVTNENADELIPTRRSLLGRLRNWDDQESWRIFFETYWRLIYQVALRAGLTDAEAQDVVQETVISVFKKMPGFEYREHNGSFKSWLLKLTSWRIADQFRRRKSAALVQPLEDGTSTAGGPVGQIVDPASSDLQAAWDADWEQNRMLVAIQRVKTRVNSKAYQMFDLLVFKEWPVSRVARAFRVNPARVYLAKHRVTNLIKQEVKKLHSEEGLLAAISTQDTAKHEIKKRPQSPPAQKFGSQR